MLYTYRVGGSKSYDLHQLIESLTLCVSHRRDIIQYNGLSSYREKNCVFFNLSTSFRKTSWNKFYSLRYRRIRFLLQIRHCHWWIKKVGQFHINFSPQSVGKIRIQIKPVFFIKRDYTSGIFLVEDLNYLFSQLRTRIKKSAPFTVKKNVRIQITGYLPIGTDPDSEV